MTKLDGRTPDLAEEHIEQLKQIFPDVFEEGKIDFDKLKQDLGEYLDDENERYNFTWNGKGKALRLSQTPSTGTLRPCPKEDESQNWNDTQNLYIEGDNLEVLKLLQKSYHGKIKMIYIDPPYNTGNDFVYPDNFSDSIENYKKITKQADEEGHWLSTNKDSNGKYHTDWLNMMYPRLRLARNLLTDDGVIFISIDDNEQGNLKKICDEVLGEENFLAQVVWERAYSPVNLKKHFSTSHDYIVCYAKNVEFTVCNGLPRSDEANDRYDNPDNDPRGPWKSSDLSVGPIVPEKVYEIVTPSGRKVLPPNGYCWRLDKARFMEFVEDNRIWFGTDGNNVPSIKRFLSEVKQGMTPMTIWKYTEVGHSQDAAQKLKQLFDGKAYFDYPKSVDLIKRCAQLYSDSNSIILDFFSGSATTAHAVMQLNAEDGGNRKFIMVQLPEPCAEGTEAAKAGYQNICEIGKERIRRAGEKIKTEVEAQNAQLKMDEEPEKVPDIGFKVFKLDSSNLKKWQPDYDHFEQTLWDSVSNYMEGRSELDVVYEIMLKMGLDLTWPLDKHTIGGKNVYAIGMGALMICLDDNITTDVADGMAALHKELAPETWKVVFKDNGFATDSAKVNVKEILKCAGLDEDAFTTV
jgi:adenine-specific DNA-methyltransferase